MKINGKFEKLLNMRKLGYTLSALLSAVMLVAVVLWGCTTSSPSGTPVSGLVVSYYGKSLLPAAAGQENASASEVTYKAEHTNYNEPNADVADIIAAYTVTSSGGAFSVNKGEITYNKTDETTALLMIPLQSTTDQTTITYIIEITLLPRVTPTALTELVMASVIAGAQATAYLLEFTEDTSASAAEGTLIFTNQRTLVVLPGDNSPRTFSITGNGANVTVSPSSVSIDTTSSTPNVPYNIVVTETIPSEYPSIPAELVNQKVTYRLFVTITDTVPDFALESGNLMATTLAGYYTGDLPVTVSDDGSGIWTFTVTGLLNRAPADYPMISDVDLFRVTNTLTLPVGYEYESPMNNAYEISANPSIAFAIFDDPTGRDVVSSMTLASFSVVQVLGVPAGMDPPTYTVNVVGAFAEGVAVPIPILTVNYQGSPTAAVVQPGPATKVYTITGLTNRDSVNRNSIVLPEISALGPAFEYVTVDQDLEIDDPDLTGIGSSVIGSNAFSEADLGISFTVQERGFPLTAKTFTARGAFAAQKIPPVTITAVLKGSTPLVLAPTGTGTQYTVTGLTNRDQVAETERIIRLPILASDARYVIMTTGNPPRDASWINLSFDLPAGTAARNTLLLIATFSVQDSAYRNSTEEFTVLGNFAAQMDVCGELIRDGIMVRTQVARGSGNAAPVAKNSAIFYESVFGCSNGGPLFAQSLFHINFRDYTILTISFPDTFFPSKYTHQVGDRILGSVGMHNNIIYLNLGQNIARIDTIKETAYPDNVETVKMYVDID